MRYIDTFESFDFGDDEYDGEESQGGVEAIYNFIQEKIADHGKDYLNAIERKFLYEYENGRGESMLNLMDKMDYQSTYTDIEHPEYGFQYTRKEKKGNEVRYYGVLIVPEVSENDRPLVAIRGSFTIDKKTKEITLNFKDIAKTVGDEMGILNDFLSNLHRKLIEIYDNLDFINPKRISKAEMRNLIEDRLKDRRFDEIENLNKLRTIQDDEEDNEYVYLSDYRYIFYFDKKDYKVGGRDVKYYGTIVVPDKSNKSIQLRGSFTYNYDDDEITMNFKKDSKDILDIIGQNNEDKLDDFFRYLNTQLFHQEDFKKPQAQAQKHKPESDPSKLSQKELGKLIDMALDKGDYKEVERLGKFLEKYRH